MVNSRLLPLSLPEREELSDLERTIEHGLATFTEVGMSLLMIRDRRLYRGTHATFEDYCLERWTMTRHYANRLIAAHGVAAGLVTIGTNPPENEAQARELAGLDPEEAAEVLEEARAEAAAEQRKVTAKDIAAVAKKAGIDPARLNRPPDDQRAKALTRIRASLRAVRKELGRLDAGEQDDLIRWLGKMPDFLED